jgi:hypothetical protein
LSGQQRAQILLNLFGLAWTAARTRLPGKRAQGCRARLYAMVQKYAESMVKLDNNAVF